MSASSPASRTLANLQSLMFASPSAKTYSHAGALLLLLPSALMLLTGFVYPLARLVALSLPDMSLELYIRIFREPLYLNVLFSTTVVALAVMCCCLLLGFPVAYAMVRLKRPWALILTGCVLIPLWTSVLVRSYAWIVLLQRTGIVNQALLSSKLINEPLRMIYTQGAVIVAMTHVLLPFMIMPIFASLRAIPPEYVQAAMNLGSTRFHAFRAIIVPLSLPGIFAGSVISFVLALGFYVTPALVGGAGSLMMATLIGQQTTVLLDWPFAAALSTSLLVVTLAVVIIFRRTLSLNKGLNSGI
ncbi:MULTISPECIES: ABC transporter permease [Agrobacterium]|uniref:ABC transporter, membrane spanning protein (Mannopine) n=1 Tax=Agrobacterium genomosp. 2 str. CFBP 5494 TaxID=1183436 RepID=A0A9W5B769_9HYPH|nr:MULTISPECIES: ABC transporter permease [Agrobacterium]OJH51829.1 ABC transporter permease [Agrobacterium pusense]OJH59892.1 ABC transporter permease [Agrobacterium pusense]CUX02933.1 ABC transporter, membrane spanning protein (mannopine) [Agrobacterium genomosp. 2 str. CFBP 5494]